MVPVLREHPKFLENVEHTLEKLCRKKEIVGMIARVHKHPWIYGKVMRLSESTDNSDQNIGRCQVFDEFIFGTTRFGSIAVSMTKIYCWLMPQREDPVP
jgi:hypothetical protein